jgi:prephenate dehydrogenase
MKRNRVTKPTVAILGTGLIGASIGLALRERRSLRVIGWDVYRRNSRAAKHRGALDEVARTWRSAVAKARFVILAVPLKAAIRLLPGVISAAAAGSAIMDTAPLKKPFETAVKRALASRRDVTFVGGHPLAGSEHNGPAHARADLFAGRTFFLCPLTPGRTTANRRAAVGLQRASALVKMLGAAPVKISADRHDRMIAATSALPQILASTLTITVARAGLAKPTFAGPGLVDTTRLAASPAYLWADTLCINKRNVLDVVRRFETTLKELRAHIKLGNARRLSAELVAAGRARRRLDSETWVIRKPVGYPAALQTAVRTARRRRSRTRAPHTRRLRTAIVPPFPDSKAAVGTTGR